MASTDDWGGVSVEQPKADDWGGVPVSEPSEPKVPDMSGVQKTAQDNLSAGDNKEAPAGASATPQTPTQKLDTAMGMPVSSILSGNSKNVQVPAAIRGHYVDALKNGDAADGTDFMQSALMSIAPLISRLAYNAMNPVENIANIGEAAEQSVKGTAGLLMYPFLSQENKQALLENEQLSDYKNPEKPKPTEVIRRGEELEQATVGKAMGGLYWPVSALLAGTPLNQAIQQTGGAPTKPGDIPTVQSLIPGAIGASMDILGGLGLVHGAGELSNLRAKRAAGPMPPPGTGPWDNLPGHEAIKDVVAKTAGKDQSAISSSDIDTAIANGSKDIFPHGQDFHDVAAVMGHETPDTLHEIYKQTGIKPDQVFEDAQHDPQIAGEVAEGKIPEAYQKFIEPPKIEEKPEPEKPQEKPVQNLQVKVSEDNKSFNVVDKEGDHVQGGFDSYEDAKQYIEDEKHGEIPEEPPEWTGSEHKPIIDKSDPFYKYQNKLGRGDEEIQAMQEARGNSEVTLKIAHDALSPIDTSNVTQIHDEKSLWKMSPEELESLRDEEKLSDREKLVRALGSQEAADHYNKLYRKSNSAFDHEGADKAWKELERIEDNFTPEQQRLVHGVGDSSATHEDMTDILNAHNDIRFSPHDSDSHVAYIGTLGLRRISPKEILDVPVNGGSIKAQEAFIRFKGAFDELIKRGVPRDNIPVILARGMAEHSGMSLNDAAAFVGDFVKEVIDLKGSYKTEKTAAGEQSVIPGAEKISDRALAERNMGKPLQSSVSQKSDIGGLFDTEAQKQGDLLDVKPKVIKPNIIPPSENGRPTSLSTFLRNNGAKFDQNGELVSIKNENGKVLKGDDALDHAGLISQNHGYFAERPAINDLQNTLRDTDGGREHFRGKDAERIAKSEESAQLKKQNDPAYIEHEAAQAGIDTDKVEGETDRQRTRRLLRGLEDIYRNEQGSTAPDLYRKVVGNTIIAAEKFVGKLTGSLFEKLGDGYVKTFQPELVSDKAKRADAYMAKFKTSLQEAENAFYRQSEMSKRAWDKSSSEERMQWLYDHETGRWNEEDDPAHARYQALYDAMHKVEKEAIGGDPDKGYKENYLPHQWEDPKAVKNYFRSDAMIRKYGADWFTKASTFNLIQEGVRAGFELKTDNPESMLVARQLASHNMIATMDLLHDMESSGLAKTARTFSVDKRIAKTEAALKDAQGKYDIAHDKINDPNQLHWDFSDPAVSKYMKQIQDRIDKLKGRLDDFNKEKSDNKLTPEQMKELKDNGFKIIGPDSKVWNIHQEAAPLWKNAMESKGLWENQGVIGDAYRTYTGAKALWTQAKLGLSLFHPFHVAMINLASGIAATAEHLVQGGKLSDLALKDSGVTMGITKGTFKGQDHPAVVAWNTGAEARTPEQQQMVTRMVEGGFKPTMSARDTVHFRENFDKAINGIGLNNLRLIGTAIQLPGLLMKPFFEHWIPGMKSEIYLRRYQDALDRDPSLANDAGKRGEIARQIAKDTDRTYGEMNNDVQFWNRNVRDSFNAAFISGGWKLAQIYNARGLLTPAKIAYNFAKTGEFSKDDITFNTLHAYTYTALTLATGGAINAMLGNPIGTAKDDAWDMVKNLVFPQTGEKNPDGTPIRLSQPAFAKDAYMLARDINTKGLLSGSGSFLYHQTLLPGISDTLNNRDFTGRELISDPTDLHQWANAGWNFISPIAVSTYEKADAKHSEIGKVAGFLGFPTAGAYINQTPFEQKVLYTYSEQNPPKGNIYTVQLKQDLKSAMANGKSEDVTAIQKRMREEGMTDKEISSAAHTFTKPFVDVAWKKLSVVDQKRLIDSASEEEKQKFKIKRGGQ